MNYTDENQLDFYLYTALISFFDPYFKLAYAYRKSTSLYACRSKADERKDSMGWPPT